MNPTLDLVSLQRGRIRLWRFKKTWRSRIALQHLLLPLVPKLNRFGVKKGRRLMFQCIFGVVLSFLNQPQRFTTAWPRATLLSRVVLERPSLSPAPCPLHSPRPSRCLSLYTCPPWQNGTATRPARFVATNHGERASSGSALSSPKPLRRDSGDHLRPSQAVPGRASVFSGPCSPATRQKLGGFFHLHLYA